MMVAKDDRVIVGGFANYLNTQKSIRKIASAGSYCNKLCEPSI